MVDRILKLPSDAAAKIKEEGFGWFIDGDNDEYVTDDAILVSKAESDKLTKASEECYRMFYKAMEHVSETDQWSRLGLPEKMIPLIRHDWDRKIPHLCGRMDFAGGIEEFPIKLIEFNSDTSTLMPESAYFQKWLTQAVEKDFKGSFNQLKENLTQILTSLKKKYSDRPATLLLTSLGYEEDILNLAVIQDAAEAAGFEVDYADLKEVVFGEDGVFLRDHDEPTESYIQYHFMYKLVPWEFMMFEEPELLDVMSELMINHDLIVMNPAYTIVYQAKHIMSVMYELFPDSPYLLPTYDSASFLKGKSYVRKVNFGRMGENIKIVDADGKTLAKNKGDFGQYTKIFQEFAEMYEDEDGDIYQPSMFVVMGRASCLSFRRRDDLIIDDDAEFVSHVIF